MVRIKPILSPHTLRGLLNLTPTTPSITTSTLLHQQQHRAASSFPRIPAPTPFVPDVATFLTLIGRGLSAHAAKFPTWESLFATTSDQLRELGIEPPRTRRYLLQWRERFRRGMYGIGGDLQHVVEGRGELRVIEEELPDEEAAAKLTPEARARLLARRPQRFVVNVPPGKRIGDCGPDDVHRVTGFGVRGAGTIFGPYALPLKAGEGAVVAVTPDMWEFKRGRKIDGGERRRTEVRYKKRIAERREARERGQ
ncbi:IGR protein motif-domain-containing protein [Camillea tinctor]|nr:IGR protein motif-domain-containing protein [Camillea tinctor]